MGAVRRYRVIANRYCDSVTLLGLSARLLDTEGVEAASAVMATVSNLEQVFAAGLDAPEGLGGTDLLVTVRGTDAGCTAALASVEELLDEPRPSAAAHAGAAAAEPLPSIGLAVAHHPELSLALISVPGPFAAAEARKALARGLHVMLFSDNVTVADEAELKAEAARRALVVMGPDCGTALVQGVPLGFANAVARGPIGVIGASGTGMQEVMCRIDRLGSGISHALGTGGRDLSEGVGGATTVQCLDLLAADEATEVIVIVSKPPSPSARARVMERCRAISKPVVMAFLGAPPQERSGGGGPWSVSTLRDAADAAVSLARGEQPPAPAPQAPPPAAAAARAGRPDGPGRLLAAFCGGTFCYEAQLVLARLGVEVESNVAVKGGGAVPVRAASGRAVDFGDDEYTRGRPHPMIDPSLRDRAVLDAWADPSIAVVLFDVVLGHGAALDPAGRLVAGLAGEADGARRRPGPLAIAHVCGTDADPQVRRTVVAQLEGAGVLVAGSNADAAAWAAEVVRA